MQQRRDICAANPPVTTDTIIKTTKMDKKAPKNTVQSPETKSKSVIDAKFDEYFSAKLSPVYNEV